MNKIILMGRLGADPELRRTPNDIPVTSFSIAVNRPRSKDGNQVTDWIDLVAWRYNAEFIAKYFGKGKLILIEGSLQTRTYEDKQGNNRKVFEVLVDRAHFCGDAPSSGKSERNDDPYGDGSFTGGGYNQSNESSSKSSGGAFEMGSDDDFELIDNDDDLPF